MEKIKHSLLSFLLMGLAVLLLLPQSSSAQRYETKKKKIFEVSIYDGDVVTDGILYSTSDSTIVIFTEAEYAKYKQRKDYKLITVPYDKIYVLKLARKGKFLRSLGIAALTGLTIGIIGGASMGDDDPTDPNPISAKTKASIGGGAGLIGGLLTGFVIGFTRKSYKIENNAAIFKSKREAIDMRSIASQ